MIEFNDGSTADTGGEFRLEEGPGGWCVVGEGVFLPAADKEAGELLLRTILDRGIFIAMKAMKSPGFREKLARELAELAAANVARKAAEAENVAGKAAGAENVAGKAAGAEKAPR